MIPREAGSRRPSDGPAHQSQSDETAHRDEPSQPTSGSARWNDVIGFTKERTGDPTRRPTSARTKQTTRVPASRAIRFQSGGVEGDIGYVAVSEQGVDERSRARSTQNKQQAEDEQEHEDGQQPPPLVLLHEAPQFAKKAGAACARCGPFKLVGILTHGDSEEGSVLPEIGGDVPGGGFRIPEALPIRSGTEPQFVSAQPSPQKADRRDHPKIQDGICCHVLYLRRNARTAMWVH